MRLPLDSIRIDGGTQARVGLRPEAVDSYTSRLEAGEVPPPVIVYHDGAAYWLADGFHRVESHKRLGLADIDAEVRLGDADAAFEFNVQANRDNGVQFTRDDTQAILVRLLTGSKWAGHSDRQIAKMVGVGHATVSRVRNSLTVSRETVEARIRTGADGRTINTANIGKRPPAPKSDPTPPARPPEPDALVTATNLRPEDVDAFREPEPKGDTVSPEPRTPVPMVDRIREAADAVRRIFGRDGVLIERLDWLEDHLTLAPERELVKLTDALGVVSERAAEWKERLRLKHPSERQ